MPVKGANTAQRTAEEEQTDRRAARERKRSAKAGTPIIATPQFYRQPQPILYGAVKPRAEREAEEMAKQRELDAATAHFNHAATALSSSNITTLTEGSPARTVAEKVLLFFPVVTLAEGERRLQTAVDAAKADLPKDLYVSEKAFGMGVNRARFALNWAYDQSRG